LRPIKPSFIDTPVADLAALTGIAWPHVVCWGY
jgi:hypothetical protein